MSKLSQASPEIIPSSISIEEETPESRIVFQMYHSYYDKNKKSCKN
jgi:hypothetical protein